MIKRTWHYVQKPAEHDISCPKCKGRNLDWSEFEHHIWCYDCNLDLDNYVSALSGPVPVKLAAMLGIRVDRYLMEEQKIEYYDFTTEQFIKLSLEQYKEKLQHENKF